MSEDAVVSQYPAGDRRTQGGPLVNSEDGDSEASGGFDGGASRTYAWGDGDRPSTAIVDAVAEATGRELRQLPPLFQTVDADALDALLAFGYHERDVPLEVTFTYVGIEVTVTATGSIELRPNDPSDD